MSRIQKTTQNEDKAEAMKSGFPPPYAYMPLNHSKTIRLLELHAAPAPSDEIIVTLSHHSLDSAPAYHALSYTWGSPEDKATIRCHPGEQPFLVTRNLESALRRLRHPTEDRIFWIDAICIDQSNIPERNSQVAIMASIYKTASSVVIDLGEGSDESDLAIDVITRCTEDRLYSFESGMEGRDAVNSFYRRPWFQRMWVLQEAFMSTEAVVVCGRKAARWDEFRVRWIWVDSRPAGETENWHVQLPAIVPFALQVGSCQSRTYDSQDELLSLLCRSRTCKATDPRDKVFALLSILSEAARGGLIADYAESNTTAKVYTEVAACLLSQVGLRFLSCIHGKSLVDHMPSWVPDWSLHIREQWIIGTSNTYWPLSAGGDTRVFATILNAEGSIPILKARGVMVDTIHECFKWAQSANHDYPLMDSFLEHSIEYRELRGAIHHDLPVYSKPWIPKTNETRIHPARWARVYGLPLDLNGNETDNDLIDLFTCFCVGQQLGLSSNGYFGLVPENSQKGDRICVFLGSNIPFILRQAEDGKFTLVGEAYVYGLMKGEALDGIDTRTVYDERPLSPLEDFLIV